MIEKRTAQDTSALGAGDARSAATPHKRHDDWRGETIDKIRALIRQADPWTVEDIKVAEAVERYARCPGMGA